MFFNEGPFADLATLVRFINDQETETDEFTQTAATPAGGNEIRFDPRPANRVLPPIDAVPIPAGMTNDQAVSLVNDMRGQGYQPICFADVNLTGGQISAVFLRTPPTSGDFTFTKASMFGLNPDGSVDHGDNGIGAWGDLTANRTLAGASIPLAVGIKQFGSKAAIHNKLIEVVNLENNLSVVVPIVDLGPKDGPGSPVSKGVALDLTFAAHVTALHGDGMISVKYRFVPSDALTGPSDEARPGGNNAALFKTATEQVGVLSSHDIPGTEHGNLGCAWAVNKIVQLALGQPIGGGLSTASMYDALRAGRGRLMTAAAVTPGTIIISPTQGGTHGHAGVVGENGAIFSNRSSDGLWAQNHHLAQWIAHYQGDLKLKVLFYDII